MKLVSGTKRKRLWLIALASITLILGSWLALKANYWIKRRAGSRIEAIVEVDGSEVEHARVYRHNKDAHIVLVSDNESYFLRGSEVGYNPGPYWGEYFGSIYTKADGIYAEFPPSVKTEPWDPQPVRSLDAEGNLESFEFVSIDNKQVTVTFLE